jgi:ABC-type transport system involved in cytochrome c biogenesis permease subunit
MTLSTDGMRWEGLFRALQGDISRALVTTVIVGLALFAISRMIASRQRGGSLSPANARSARMTARIVALAIIGLASATTILKMTGMIATNRIPRSDADKSAVYDQMRNNAAPNTQTKPAK